MDRIKSFYDENLASANESTAAGLAATAAVFTLLYIPSAIIERRRKARKMAEAKADRHYQEQVRMNKEERQKRLIAEIKKAYSVDASPIPDGAITSNAQLKSTLFNETKKFLSAVKRSPFYKTLLEDAIRSDYLKDDDYTLDSINRDVKIMEGVSGWQSSLQIIDGSQEEAEALYDVTNEVCNFVGARFANYLMHTPDTGDGDEGHVYYELENLD